MSRYTDLPFPGYTYIPGKTPHPVREADGHSYGKPEPYVEQFAVDQWSDCEAFLYGVDLFNAEFYWEAHEQWEAVWHAVGRTGIVADFLKGLIKLAAAGVKSGEGRSEGVKRHAQRAADLFAVVAAESPQFCGFDVAELFDLAHRLRDNGIAYQPRMTLTPKLM